MTWLMNKNENEKEIETMTIERKYPENMSNETIYDMLTAPTSRKLNEAYGVRIAPAAIVVYISDSETRCVAIQDQSGEIFRSSGSAAIREICNGMDILGEAFKDRYIVPVKRTSKQGRDYCSAVLEKA